MALFFLNLCALLLHEVPWAAPCQVARTWAGVRDEHPSCDVARCVGAELVCKDCHGAAGERLHDAQCGGQADDSRANHCDLGCCHVQDAVPEERGTCVHLEITYPVSPISLPDTLVRL